jgi:2-iminobutanoate/2-iminopropanoate deaminase
MKPIAINSPNIPHPAMSYSQAVRVGNLVFVAGQAGINFESGFISTDFETQARQAFDNLSAVLNAADSGLDKVAKTTIWLVDASNFDCLNKLYAEYFPTNPPARSTPIVALPKKEFQLSIEAIATIDTESR